MSENVDIVYPDECPKCRCGNVLCDTWVDSYIVWLNITCQDCHYFWREKVDLTI